MATNNEEARQIRTNLLSVALRLLQKNGTKNITAEKVIKEAELYEAFVYKISPDES